MRLRNKVGIETLDNGFMLYTIPNKYNSNIIGIGARVGILHDKKNARGLNHLLEHMSFRDSDEWSLRDMYLLCERTMGGPFYNVYTSYLSTYFGTPDLSRKQYGFEFLDMLLSILFKAKLDVTGLRTERAAVNCERSLTETSQAEVMSSYWLNQLIYRNNPIRKYTTCQPEELKKITLKDIKEFRAKHYVSENMFAVTSSQYAPRARQVLSRLPDHKKPPRFIYDPRDVTPSFPDVREKIHIMPGLELHHRHIGFPVVPSTHPDTVGLEILKRILGFRLRFRLREENQNFDKGCYRMYTYNETSAVHGIFSIWYATRSKEFADTAEGRVLEEINRLASELVEPDLFTTIIDSELEYFRKMFVWYPDIVVEKVIFASCNHDKHLTGLHGYGEAVKLLTRKKIRDLATKYLTNGYARAIVRAK